MRIIWPLLALFCFLSLSACTVTTHSVQQSSPAASELNYLERQTVELQTTLERFDGTQIESREGIVVITMRCDSIFESNSGQIKPATCTEMDCLAEVAKKYPETSIKIDAHTDCVRSEEENLALSELQAWTLKKALVDRGVAASRVKARGWGESKPVASNATEAGRRANRRITIVLAPNQS